MPTTLVIKFPNYLFAELRDNLAKALSIGVVSRFRSSKRYPVRCRAIFILDDTPRTLLKQGRLSSDLFSLMHESRLLKLPPLRYRGDDALSIACYFARRAHGRSIVGFDKAGEPDAVMRRILKSRKWLGNVAELKAFITSLIVPSLDEIVDDEEVRLVHQIKMMMQDQKPFSLRSQLRSLTSLLVKRALRGEAGNRVRTARLLGRTEASLR